LARLSSVMEYNTVSAYVILWEYCIADPSGGQLWIFPKSKEY
jgi:hypothetical protein